ncbi:hypothetical protein CORC01_01182 [Colletotrichum orchidophilum]|uniref:Uncharacterized protein n=1 Tax=Colletotrichum orchidophilum TaxID=1209926 RepID=A0A1G4BQ64_9PEZI|nr:uncharacterized protein CORC01_01182 [Colletotrichum orchidophilum]OHF03463.1 hypothetical protein CORC01_01182 [Colletotrichum orchidophilum]
MSSSETPTTGPGTTLWLPITEPPDLATATGGSGGSFYTPDPTTPCFNRCNELYIYIQAVGTEPSICDADSYFRTEYKECISCIKAIFTSPEKYITERIEPRFSEYLNFCSNMAGDLTYPASLLTVVTRVHYGYITDLNDKVIPGTLKTVTATDVKWPDNTLIGGTWPTASWATGVETSGASETGSSGPIPGNSAWIAGPVVGVITAIMLFLGALWFLRRRRQRMTDREESLVPDGGRGGYGKEEFEKAQLHSECIPHRIVMELEGSYPTFAPDMSPAMEMNANEVPAQELSVPGSQHVEGVTEKRRSPRPESPVLG